jgi:hypothetical protein
MRSCAAGTVEAVAAHAKEDRIVARTQTSGMSDKALRDDLLHLLGGRGAHVEFKRAVAGLDEKLRGTKPRGLPYSPWQQIEHMRIAQRDILDYIRDPDYVERKWPDDYWPAAAPPNAAAWDKSIKGFQADLKTLQSMVADPATDLLAQVPHDKNGPTILHEVLLVADHNAYHLGQLIVVRRILGAWSE